MKPCRPAVEAPARDAYALRLVAAHKLYDRGTLLSHCPSLAELAPGATLRVHPTDLERLGLGASASVKVSSARTSTTLEAHADPTLPQGTALLHANQPDGPDPAAFIDATAAVTEIRLETV